MHFLNMQHNIMASHREPANEDYFAAMKIDMLDGELKMPVVLNEDCVH